MNFYGSVFALQTLSKNFAFFNNTYWSVNLFVYFACGFFYATSNINLKYFLTNLNRFRIKTKIDEK
jgi:hypothetical protein